MNKESHTQMDMSVKESNRSLGKEGLIRRAMDIVAGIINRLAQTEGRKVEFEDRF